MEETNNERPCTTADSSLFQYLKERNGKRTTKIEAYCSLMNKAEKGFVSAFLKNHDYRIGHNQCHVTITDLASEWKWHRATVRSFLDRIEEFGLIERYTLPKSIVITIPEQIFQSPLQRNGSLLPAFVRNFRDGLSGWTSGQLQTVEIGQGLDERMKKETGQLTDEQRERAMRTLAAEAAAAAMERRMFSYRDEDIRPLMEFWEKDLQGNLILFLAFADSMAGYLVDGDISGVKDNFNLFSDDLRPLASAFKALIYHNCTKR